MKFNSVIFVSSPGTSYYNCMLKRTHVYKRLKQQVTGDDSCELKEVSQYTVHSPTKALFIKLGKV